MRRFNYLNFSKLELPDNIATPTVSYSPGLEYVSFHIKKRIIDQVMAEFPIEIANIINPEYDILFQTIGPQMNNHIHKDGRVFAINYLIDKGGDNVETLFFDDSKKLIETNLMPEQSWALLHTNTFHCVNNISTIRKAITVSFGGFPNFDNKLKGNLLVLLSEHFKNE